MWRTFKLKPHLTQEFKISPDTRFTEKVEDVVGLCLNPPESAVVLCAEREDPDCRPWTPQPAILPLLPTTPERRTHDYRRHATTDLHAALDMATDKVITAMTAPRRAKEFRAFLNQIDAEVPSGLDVHIVLDNVSTHTPPLRSNDGN